MRKAFTLIELLVVITVVAILATILFPAFARARESGRRSVCISNMRQIGCAVGAYLSDWNDRYPWAERVYSFGDPPRRPQINDVLTEYVRDSRIWICPSDIGETFYEGGMGYLHPTPPLYSDNGLSYGYYGIHSPTPVMYYGMAGFPASRVRRPCQAILIHELRPWHGMYNKLSDTWTSPALYNVLYSDGHIAQRTIQHYAADQSTAFRP